MALCLLNDEISWFGTAILELMFVHKTHIHNTQIEIDKALNG